MELCRDKAQTPNKRSLFTWKMAWLGISGFILHWQKSIFLSSAVEILFCSPLALGLKSPVLEGNEKIFSSLTFIWWNPTTLYHIRPVDPLQGSPRSFYITSHKDCRSILNASVFHPRWCSVLPSLLCGLFYSKSNLKYDWVIRILPMATSRDQLHYSWDFVHQDPTPEIKYWNIR